MTTLEKMKAIAEKRILIYSMYDIYPYRWCYKEWQAREADVNEFIEMCGKQLEEMNAEYNALFDQWVEEGKPKL